MNVRDLIYELIQMEMSDEVRIFDIDTDKLYETKDIETGKGFVDLVISIENKKDLSGMAVPSRPK